jgi:hypothetical protein
MIKQLLGDLFLKKKVKKSKGLTKKQCLEMCQKANATGVCPKACCVCAYNYMLYEEKK